MAGPSVPIQPDFTENPLRTALVRGDLTRMQSGPALRHLLALSDRALLTDAIVAHIHGMIGDLAAQIVAARKTTSDPDGAREAIGQRLLLVDPLRAHCHALALEWRLAVDLEAELAIDPVLTPLVQALVADKDTAVGAMAMAALAAQARFAQAQRRMQLPLDELPAELFHDVLVAAREPAVSAEYELTERAETRLRAAYDEAAGRLSLLSRLLATAGVSAAPLPAIEEAGASLWLSALAARSGESRDATVVAAADPLLGRLLLTLRAAGVSPVEAERQALRVQPDAVLPRGLEDVGKREAAQWLAEAGI